MKWYLSCGVGNGLKDAIWRLMAGDGLKDSIQRSVDSVRDSLARVCIPVIGGDSAGEYCSLS